jgi:hypothetical protein
LKQNNGSKKWRALTVLFGFVLVSVLVYPTIHAQNSNAFTPTDKFIFPDSNSSLSFYTEGNYQEASFENDAWTFINLKVNASDQNEGLNLTVSARDSNLIIRAYQRFNLTRQGIILSYVVDGEGEQTLDFDFTPGQGAWTVIFNEEIIPEDQGWARDDSRLTVTGATANITLFYVSYSNIDDNTNKTFYEQHSIAIATSGIVAATVIVALTIKFTQGNTEKDG